MISRRNRKVLLHTIDELGRPGPTIEGVLVREGWRRDFVLWCPKYHEGEDSTVSLSGHVEIPRERVLFKQIIG